MIKRILLASVVAVSVAGFVKAQNPHPAYFGPVHGGRGNLLFVGAEEVTGTNAQIEEIKAEVLKSSEARSAAIRRKDKAAVLASLADGWAYTNERGETYSKEQWVDDVIDGNLHFVYAQHVDVEWHVFGDSTVVETGRSNSILVYKGKISHGPRRETAVYAKIHGKWLQVSLHVGFIPAEQRDFTFPASALPH
ncbi:MAG: nuclear transport factor 2 family protein [Terriglobia bacterium]